MGKSNRSPMIVNPMEEGECMMIGKHYIKHKRVGFEQFSSQIMALTNAILKCKQCTS